MEQNLISKYWVQCTYCVMHSSIYIVINAFVYVIAKCWHPYMMNIYMLNLCLFITLRKLLHVNHKNMNKLFCDNLPQYAIVWYIYPCHTVIKWYKWISCTYIVSYIVFHIEKSMKITCYIDPWNTFLKLHHICLY